jgi:hypothetical protein
LGGRGSAALEENGRGPGFQREGDRKIRSHYRRNAFEKLGVWQTNLTRPQLERAIQETERFYRSRDLDHWADAVREFYNTA